MRRGVFGCVHALRGVWVISSRLVESRWSFMLMYRRRPSSSGSREFRSPAGTERDMSLPLLTSSKTERKCIGFSYISVMSRPSRQNSANMRHCWFPSQILYFWQANKENAIQLYCFLWERKKQRMRVSFCHVTEGEFLKNILVSFYNIITMNEAVKI